jgi:hypothetical protein
MALLLLPACVTIKPVQINSDPNQERLQRIEERTERDNVEAFIAEHPDLSVTMRKQLREGTLSRSEALEQLKKKPASHP